MVDSWDSCLKVLGLEPGASHEAIKSAYRDLTKVWHPDRFSHDAALQRKADEQLKAINEAYEKLRSYEPDPVPGDPAIPLHGEGPRVIRPQRRVIPVDKVWIVVTVVAALIVLLLVVSAV
ncbi:MAG: J domain-containing protein [Gemmatimonadales bacterium]